VVEVELEVEEKEEGVQEGKGWREANGVPPSTPLNIHTSPGARSSVG